MSTRAIAVAAESLATRKQDSVRRADDAWSSLAMSMEGRCDEEADSAALPAGVAACASNEASDGDDETPRDSLVTTDAGADAYSLRSPLDAAPCDDCDYFPVSCSPDAFCSDGPFDQRDDGRCLRPADRSTSSGAFGFRRLGGRRVGALAHFDGTSVEPVRHRFTPDPTIGLWLRPSEEIRLVRSILSTTCSTSMRAVSARTPVVRHPLEGWSEFTPFWPLSH